MAPHPPQLRKIAILGGGIWGLSLAHFLKAHTSSPLKICVLEKSNRPGGFIATRELNGCKLETGPNGFLDSNPATLRLCKSIGLEGELLRASSSAARNRFLFLRSRLHKLPSSLMGMAFSPVLSFRSKLTILGEYWSKSREIPAEESIFDFFNRKFGTEVAQTLGDAFVTGIWGGDSTQLSLPSCFPRLRELEKEYGSLLRGIRAQRVAKKKLAASLGEPVPTPTRMWSLKGGLGDLVAKLGQSLGDSLTLDCQSIAIHPRETEGRAAWSVVDTKTGQPELYDQVILTCPAREQASILAELAPDLARELDSLPTNSIGVVGLVFPTSQLMKQGVQPDGFGYLTPQRDRRPVLGLQWCSSIFPGFRSPPEKQIWRALIGGPGNRELLEKDNAEITKIVLDELRLVGGWDLRPDAVEIIRWSKGIPQYTLGHQEKIRRIEQFASRFPGLTVAGSCLRGVAINDCVEQSEKLAKKILTGLGALVKG